MRAYALILFLHSEQLGLLFFIPGVFFLGLAFLISWLAKRIPAKLATLRFFLGFVVLAVGLVGLFAIFVAIHALSYSLRGVNA